MGVGYLPDLRGPIHAVGLAGTGMLQLARPHEADADGFFPHLSWPFAPISSRSLSPVSFLILVVSEAFSSICQFST